MEPNCREYYRSIINSSGSVTQSQDAGNTVVMLSPAAGTVTRAGSIKATSSSVTGTVTHARSIAVTLPPL